MTKNNGYLPKVPPLKARKLDGTLYRRRDDVDAEIVEMLSLRQSERAARLRKMQSETIVHLIRRMLRSKKSVYGVFVKELNRRTVRIAKSFSRELDKTTRQDIAGTVENDILTVVLSEKSSRKTEVLEVAFAAAVQKRTLNIVRTYEHSVWAHTADILQPPADEIDDADEIERPIELVADDRDGPEVLAIRRLDSARIRSAYAAVTDPLDLKVLQLHIEQGRPICSKDPGKPDVVGELGESRGQVNYRWSTALKQIRKALGVKK